MSQQNWAKILSYLYNEQESVEFLAGEAISEDDNVVSNTGLDTSTIKSELDEMDDLDLVDVEYKPTDYYTEDEERVKTETVVYSLSKKGFDVAHERELNNNRQRTNIAVVCLTAVLAIGSFLQGYSAYLSQKPLENQTLLALGLVVIGAFIIRVFLFMMGESFQSVWHQFWN